jgi:hypothetical protein
LPPELSADAIVERLRRLEAIRIKGFVSTSEGVRLVQGVGRRIQLTPVAAEVPPEVLGRLVVISASGR